MKKISRRNFLVNLLILLLAILFALLLSEIILRVLKKPVYYVAPSHPKGRYWENFFHQKSKIPDLDYELKPNVRGLHNGIPIQINRFGLRDDEIHLAKLPGQKRITVLGDSFTFGFGVEAKDGYVEKLEQILTQKFPEQKFQVLNFGVGGYNSREEDQVLKFKVSRFSPDLVIIAYSLDDPEIDPVQPLRSFYHPPSWWQYSHLLSILILFKESLKMNLIARTDSTHYLFLQPEKWQVTVQQFRDASQWSMVREKSGAGFGDDSSQYPASL